MKTKTPYTKLQNILDQIIIDLASNYTLEQYSNGFICRTLWLGGYNCTYTIMCFIPDCMSDHFEPYQFDLEVENDTEYVKKQVPEFLKVVDKIINPDVVNNYFELN